MSYNYSIPFNIVVNVTQVITVFKKKVPTIQIVTEKDSNLQHQQKKRKRKSKEDADQNRRLITKLRKGETLARNEKQELDFHEFQMSTF